MMDDDAGDPNNLSKTKLSYLCVVHHMDALVDDALGMVAQEL
jgi:hypothetical protein